MNKIKKILLLLVIIPFNCFAIEFYCDNSVLSNGTFNCVISNTSNSLAELNALLEYSPELKLIKTNYTKGYTSTGNDNNIIVTGPGLNAQTTIAVLNFKAPIVSSDQTFNISLKNIKYKYLNTEVNYHDNQDLNSLIKVKKLEEQPSTKPTVNEKIITVMFNDTTTIKTCKTSSESCIIDLSDIDPVIKEGYIFKGWNNIDNCTNGYTTTYEAKSDTTLYACFEKNTDIESINYLSKLSINEYSLEELNKEMFSYNFTVQNDVKSATIIAEAESNTAKIKISENASNLVVGENIITVDVIDNNITTSYILIINRLEKIIVSSKPLLNGFLIDNKKIPIENNNFDLSITVKYGTKRVNLIPITASDDLTYSIIGNDNLKNGSIINIKVTTPDGDLSIYNIKVNYESFAKTYMNYIYFAGMFVFCLIVYIVVKKIKTDKNNITNNDKINKKKNESNTSEKKIEKVKKEKQIKKVTKKTKKKDKIETLE